MLRIDLLPQRVRNARTNKRVVMVIVVLLIAAVLGVGSWSAKQRSTLSGLEDELAQVTKKADAVRDIKSETQNIRNRLQPIADKVRFIEQADECGYPYWERFFEVAEYIYGGAELQFFGIVGHQSGGLVGTGAPEDLYNQQGPAGTTDCAFSVTVKNTNECARFILNLSRCPLVSDLRISANVPPGRRIAENWPGAAREFGAPQLAAVGGMTGGGGGGAGAVLGGGLGAALGGGAGGAVGGAMGAMGGAALGALGGPVGMAAGAAVGGGAGAAAGGAMGGAAGGAAGAMMGAAAGRGPGAGAAGMAGGRGGMQAAGAVSQPRLDGSIDLLITCQLQEPVYVPSPPGAGGAAAAGAPGAGGMGGGMMGGMGGMGPSAGMPGGPPGAGGMEGPGMGAEAGEEGMGAGEEEGGMEEGEEEGGI